MSTRSANRAGAGPSIVKRHLTAIRRNYLSRPVQLLLETGVLNRERTLFDYGCGFGDDVRILTENGYTAAGWDPHYAPSSDKIQSDIVNLGFVLNVIEDTIERRSVLKEAYALCSSVLCVAVIYAVDSNRPNGAVFRDGMLTQKQTFQRYYERDELEQMVRSATTDSMSIVAPGVAFVFKDEEAFRRFRYERVHRRPVAVSVPSVPVTSARDRVAQLAAEFPKEWNDYVAFVDERGRPPLVVESQFLGFAQSRRVSAKHVFSWATSQLGSDRIERSAQQTKDDLLVFLAVSLFENRAKMSDLDATARSDIKHFFASFSNAMSHARESLLSVGNISLVRQHAEESRVGAIQDDGLFVIPSDLVSLPLPVRLYVMLGTIFFGSVEAADIIKVHLNSNKLTFFVKRETAEPTNAPEVYDAFKVDFVRRSISGYEHRK